jgi:CRP-like cAMP-binding protein
MTFESEPSGAWFGEGSVLKGELRPYSVVALRFSTVVLVPRDTFLWLLDESRPFSRWVIDQLNARLGHYLALIESVRFHNSTARVAYCLSELFNPQLFPSTNPEITLSQEEVGKLSGLSRQNISRALHELEAANLLHMRYGAIEIIDLKGLQNFARGASEVCR